VAKAAHRSARACAGTSAPADSDRQLAAPVLDEVQLSALAELRAEMREMRDSIGCNPFYCPHFLWQRKLPRRAAPEYFQNPTRSRKSRAAHPTNPGRETGALARFLEPDGLSAGACRTARGRPLRSARGSRADRLFSDEIELAKQALTNPLEVAPGQVSGPHVFVGAPGSGKTTALCKWLAQVALVEGRQAAVWRLDGLVANTAESLSVFSEILGVPVERCAPTNNEAARKPTCGSWICPA
jgi:hypothetical protein